MSFTRTRSGLSNLHLFYDSDLIVFTEGGTQTFTLQEIEEGKHNTYSVDIKFWKNIFDINGLEKKVSFRAIGSKTASKSFCEKIVNGEIHNIVVAKDRDLDEYVDTIYTSPFILYTKGYSWENDVFIKDLTHEQIENMLLTAETPEEVNSIIDKAFNDFKRIGKNLAKLEIMFRKNGVKFISNMNGERFFNAKTHAVINKEQFFQVLKEKKVLLDKPRMTTFSGPNICPFMTNYGKLLEALSMTVISYICKRFCNIKSIPKDIIITSMIERFANKIKRVRDEYYFNLVTNLQNA
ncbi:hypothetical protein [Candidatus Sulfurimonas baltica]|uniref:DUF4435 domain-containing protein n=1 Tax=Candidatus Sulfurimonas baltica TaxID=2740404 RepID=A0A7S7LTC8_9BACT|nr:hypothetical protein [Candidatus Sulfurimonas baltica]QOY51189.1 hypothetical protein HUE88_08595 [Candidatus Sulfurimonas baltica]